MSLFLWASQTSRSSSVRGPADVSPLHLTTFHICRSYRIMDMKVEMLLKPLWQRTSSANVTVSDNHDKPCLFSLHQPEGVRSAVAIISALRPMGRWMNALKMTGLSLLRSHRDLCTLPCFRWLCESLGYSGFMRKLFGFLEKKPYIPVGGWVQVLEFGRDPPL